MIKRYTIDRCGDRWPHGAGEWVKHDDHLAECERIRAEERERIAQMVDEKQREWWRQYKDAEDPWSYLDEHYADAAKEIADAIRSMK